MKRIDGMLSRKAAGYWPGAIVSMEERNGEVWTLDRPGLDALEIGTSWGDAQQAIWALIAQERERRKNSDK